MGGLQQVDGLKLDVSFNLVIHAFAKMGDIGRAERWLAKMRDSGVETNAISYNILADTCVKVNGAARGSTTDPGGP